MAERPDLPWVLLRRGKPLTRHLTRELGQKFYNSLIYGWAGWKEPEAALFGPGGEAWYRNGRHGGWERDDARRGRERRPEDAEAGA